MTSELQRENANECNCSLPCQRTLFEPRLSYAMLSEFNIDQIALTDPSRKLAVKAQFEKSTETQQRVVQDIKVADERVLEKIVGVGNSLASALNETQRTASDPAALSALYRMPNVFGDEDNLPQEDLSFTEGHADGMEDLAESVNVNFHDTREAVAYLISGTMIYSNGQSQILNLIRACRGFGLIGDEDPNVVCMSTLPPPLTCDIYFENVCFPGNRGYVPFLTMSAFANYEKDETIQTARSEMGQLDWYDETVAQAFPGESLNGTFVESDHYHCRSELERYQTVVLPDVINFVEQVDSLRNVTTLADAENRFADIENTINTKIGPALLTGDADVVWRFPTERYAEYDDDEEEPTPDALETRCAWFLRLYDEEVDDFKDHVEDLARVILESQMSLRNGFTRISEKLLKLLEHYNDEIAPAINTIERYLSGDVTKKELAEAMTDQELARSFMEISTINGELATEVKDTRMAAQQFAEMMMYFYALTTEQTIPFISDETQENYAFLELLMEWYEDGGGRQLIETHLANGGSFRDAPPAPNTTWTPSNIWLTLEEAVVGFEENGETVSGLHPFTESIKQSIIAEAERLVSETDLLTEDLQEYRLKIRMNTDFYM